MVEVPGLHTEVTADIADFDRKLRAVQQRLTGAGASVNEFSRTFPRFEGSVKKASSATQAYRTSLKAASAQQTAMAASTRSSVTALGNASERAKTLATQSNKAAIQAANLGAQFNDISVMLAAGQSPFMLAIQQGTQINQVMDLMGGTAREKLGALAAAATKMINPFNLATIGIIAAGAALVQFGMKAFKASEDTDKLVKRLEKVREVSAELELRLRALRIGVSEDELTLLDAIAAKEKEVAQAKLERDRLSNLQAKIMAKQAIAAKEEELVLLQKELQHHRDMVAEEERRNRANQARLDDLNAIAAMAERALDNYDAQIKAAEEHRAEVTALAKEQAEMLYLAQRFSDEAIVMSQSLEPVSTKVGLASDAAKKLEEQIGAAGVKALIFAGIDIESGVDAAAQAAARLAGQLGVSLARAIQLKNMSLHEAMGEKMPGGAGGPQGAEAPLLGWDGSSSGHPMGVIPSTVPEVGKSGGGGGGGGGGANPTDRLIADIEALRQKLLTEEEMELESYQRRQELLDQFLLKFPEKQAETNDLMERLQREHQERMAQIDVYRYGTGLQRTEQFMGDMADALAAGGDKMVKISKVFGAAQALIATWTGAAEALKLPFPANLAAFAKVLATGFGAVQAIKSVSTGSGSSSAGGAATGGAGGGVSPQIQDRRVAEFRFVGGNVLDPRAIVDAMNEAYDQGYLIRGVLS